MDQLWGLIRALKLIVLSHLIMAPIPANAYFFFKIAIDIQVLDLFFGEKIYEALFDFKDTTSMNKKFDDYEFGNKNFLYMSSSIFILLFLLIVSSVISWALH
jgi:hypothetical protein